MIIIYHEDEEGWEDQLEKIKKESCYTVDAEIARRHYFRINNFIKSLLKEERKKSLEKQIGIIKSIVIENEELHDNLGDCSNELEDKIKILEDQLNNL